MCTTNTSTHSQNGNILNYYGNEWKKKRKSSLRAFLPALWVSCFDYYRSPWAANIHEKQHKDSPPRSEAIFFPMNIGGDTWKSQMEKACARQVPCRLRLFLTLSATASIRCEHTKVGSLALSWGALSLNFASIFHMFSSLHSRFAMSSGLCCCFCCRAPLSWCKEIMEGGMIGKGI